MPHACVVCLAAVANGDICQMCVSCSMTLHLCMQVYLYDPSSSVIVMELLGAPNIILRHAIVKGEVYPHVAAHVGTFLASTLFHTSLLALDSRSFR